MPTTTQHGYRIPADDDPVADGALAIRDLGVDVDNMVGVLATGTVTVQVNGVPGNTAIITFPAGRFSAAPKVVGSANVDKWNVAFGAATSTQCECRIRSIDNTNGAGPVAVDWIAIQQ